MTIDWRVEEAVVGVRRARVRESACKARSALRLAQDRHNEKRKTRETA
jgi:hypothetical protein